jgi:hypothetical protein
MNQVPPTTLLLLRWTKASGGDDSGDPLGLELRVLTRLQSQLLHCITSITPRARYFAFLPWCVAEYARRERGASWAEGLTKAVTYRERALALGCVALHGGESCNGGGVVGSDRATEYLNAAGGEQVSIREFSKRSTTTAWDQYFGSLANFGIFVETDSVAEAEGDEPAAPVTIDALTLAPIGLRLADAYSRVVEGLQAPTELGSSDRCTTVAHLTDLASRGGICEVMLPDAEDRPLLRALFFHKLQSPGRAHQLRRQSLLLLMQLIAQLGESGIELDERIFANAVYFGETVADDGVRIVLDTPQALEEIRLRWRVFYVQFYFSLAFESLFRALVQAVGQAGTRGLSIPEVVESVGSRRVVAGVAKLIGAELGDSLLDLTAAEMLHRLGGCGCPPFGTSAEFEKAAHASASWSEPSIANHLRQWRFPLPADAFAVGLVGLVVAMGRYRGEIGTPYGWWLQSCVEDATKDLAAPSFDLWFDSQGGDWMKRPLREVVPIIVERFLVRLHEWLGYEKGSDNSRIIVHACEGRLFSTGTFDRLGVHNTRLRNALRVLADLVLIHRRSDGVFVLTPEGQAWLAQELAVEASA